MLRTFLGWSAGASVSDSAAGRDIVIPSEAQSAMQREALSAIATKAGGTLPILRGRDPALRNMKPSFDIAELRTRDRTTLRKRLAQRGANAGV